MFGVFVTLLLLCVATSPEGSAQTARDLLSGAAQPPDSVEVLREVRRAQSQLERSRRGRLPWIRGGGGGFNCDTQIGRFCVYHDSDEDRERLPDDSVTVAERDAFIARLQEVQLQFPGDEWVNGQLVYYLLEAGRRDSAGRAAVACRAAEWWCMALRGAVEHVRGDFVRAEEFFALALDVMERGQAREWRDLDPLLDRSARSLVGDGEERWDTPTVDLLWALADPLYLVEGNDRLTAHFARRTIARVRSESRNAQGYTWGDDLEELSVRYGWNRGWIRRRAPLGSNMPWSVSGLLSPYGRDWLAPGGVLQNPSAIRPGVWWPEATVPRSTYTPYYAERIVPARGQVAVFPRGDSIAVVVSTALPDSTPYGAETDSTEVVDPDAVFSWPDLPPPDVSAQTGAFVLDRSGRLLGEARAEGDSVGGLLVRSPAGELWLSAETWEPSESRAGRFRHGLRADTVVADLVTLSDLLILRDAPLELETIEETLPHVLPSMDVENNSVISVAWELWGFGFRPETVQFELALSPAGGGILSRVVDWFGGGDDDPLRVSWVEAAPRTPGPWFRSNRIELPVLEPGDYVVELRVRTQGREDISAERRIRIVDPGGSAP